jgi:hypothetical protein
VWESHDDVEINRRIARRLVFKLLILFIMRFAS